MDLRQLRYFVAVADATSFGRASTLLGVAQSAVSTQIKHLEEELGLELFVRAPRNVTLTPAGLVVLKEARKTLIQADLTLDVAQRAARGEAAGLRLGYERNLPCYLPLRIVEAFTKIQPGGALELRELTAQLQVRAIRDGELDIGIIIDEPADASVAGKLIARESLSIVCGPTNPLAKRSGVTIADIKDQELYVLTSSLAHELANTLARIFRDAGVTPHISYEADEVRVLWGLVTGGRGLSFGYRSLAAVNIPGLVFIPLIDATRTIDFYLVWNGNSHDPLLARFVNAVPVWRDE